MSRIQHRDHVVPGDPLGRVHRGRIGVGQVPELPVAVAERQGPAVVRPHPDALLRDRQDRRLPAVDEFPARVVPGPAHPVPDADPDAGSLVQFQAVADIPRRIDPAPAPVRMGEDHPAPLEARHPAGVVLPDPVVVQVAVEYRHIPLLPVPDVPRLGPAHPEPHQYFQVQGPALQDALGIEPLAHRVVDLPAQCMGGRQDRGAGTGLGRELQPDLGGAPAEPVERDLVQVLPEQPEGILGRIADHRMDGGPEVRRTLAEDVVHHRRLHARLLQLPERLARPDGPELADIAHHGHAPDPEPSRDPHQPEGLRRGRHGHLVHDEQASLVALAQLHEVLRVHGTVRHLAMARQEPLQRPRRRAGLPGQCQRRPRGRRQGDHLLPPGDVRDLPEHGGLAGARIALHPDDPVVAEQDGPDPVLLSPGQGAGSKPFLHRGFRRKGFHLADPGLHPGDHLPPPPGSPGR